MNFDELTDDLAHRDFNDEWLQSNEDLPPLISNHEVEDTPANEEGDVRRMYSRQCMRMQLVTLRETLLRLTQWV